MSPADFELESLWENPVRKALREKKPVVGLTITVPSVEVAAQAASLGFDFLWIEMEHSPTTLETLRGMVLATRGLRAIPFARVPVNELWMAKRVRHVSTRHMAAEGLAPGWPRSDGRRLRVITTSPTGM
ncbi:MAG: hypothetical protein M1423_10230 [Acidobacteria bacterium]|nr:hypothetical protein [Acidobacteriota bacterium]